MEDFLRRIIQYIAEVAAETGEITFSELNELLPPDKVNSEQIELILTKIDEIGIGVVEDR